MAIITYPVTFPATPGPARWVPRPANAVGLVTTPHSLTERVQQHSGDLLRIDVEMPAMIRALGAPWHAALTSLDSEFGTCLYGPSGDGKTPRGAATGTPLIDGASQTGDDVNTKGWTNGITGIVKAGDWLSWGSGVTMRLHQVMADANSDGSGLASIPIWPRIRESPADNLAITTVSPLGAFRLVRGSLHIEVDADQNYQAAFALVEARRGA